MAIGVAWRSSCRRAGGTRWLVVAAAILLVGGSCERAGGARVGATSDPLADGASTFLGEAIDTFPELDFLTYERLLYELRGQPVVVNLWASWCIPCRAEAPLFVRAADRYGDEIRFLGVDYLDELAPAKDFYDTHGVTYASISDPSGEIHDQLGFFGLPNTIFYAADGSIVDTWTGPITAPALGMRLEQLLDT
jgi:cytochrome c biogenesis protein CcmG, thiol:disulfide interchange protein DsbE